MPTLTHRAARPGRRSARRVGAFLLAVAAVLSLASGPAVLGDATSASAAAAPPEPAGAWFGPDLDWGSDGPDGYAGRLGATPSLYGVNVDYPLDRRAGDEWRRSARAAAAQGAVLVVSLEPTGRLSDLDAADARRADDLLTEIDQQYGTLQLVRFAPEMNGNWQRWGQQPTAFVGAFRELADVVHAGTSQAQTVWAPSYGAGYPFSDADGRLPETPAGDVGLLDTNDDGRVTESDDPYGPYYPGDDAVDWVGQSMFYFAKGSASTAAGTSVPLVENQAPAAGEVEGRFDETWGYAEAQASSFYDRFAEGRDRPMLLDTGALYAHELEGAAELDVKQGWWRQVLAALPAHPRIAGVTWLEVERDEAEAGDRPVDWRATAEPGIAGSLRTDLQANDRIDLGPVTDRVTSTDGDAATVQVRDAGGGDEMGWIVACAGALALAFLVSGLVGRLLPRWRYPDDGSPGRDLRIDLFRGFIILAVVITHIEVAGPFSFVTLKAVGAITGAEMFVFLSGIVLGMVYPLGVKKHGEKAAAIGAFVRARKQYVVTLAVILIVFALSFVPFLATDAITTFTDRGTGSTGTSAEGRVYDLYPNADRLLDYPPPWYAVRQFLLLEMGPWPFNIMGLFVVLSLTIPALTWAIRRRAWWAVLLVSWALYAVGVVFPGFHLLPSQFEAVFPLFAWQVLFTHGLVIGWYRRQIVRALTTRLGKVLVGVGVVGYAGFLALIWAGHAYGFSPGPIPSGLYDTLYATGYQRVDMQWGRLVDVALVVVCVYAVLTVFWVPLSKAFGWLYVPLGQASLYVFIWQVFFVLAVASIPGLDRSSVLVGTIVHTVSVLLLWVMVKKKFLFSVVPR
ncbi:hypothetical protein ABID81_001906 [Frigoribacterium sp. PvP054]|uniref:OpgC domain-containing protein n=1 Tax=Frigoribacterium sp. PvP054 TaxID=3156438 RepID=UPI00339B698A